MCVRAFLFYFSISFSFSTTSKTHCPSSNEDHTLVIDLKDRDDEAEVLDTSETECRQGED